MVIAEKKVLSINRRKTDEWKRTKNRKKKRKTKRWHEIKSLGDESKLLAQAACAQINQWKSKQKARTSTTFSLFLSLYFLFPSSLIWAKVISYQIFNQFQKVIGKSLTIINNQPHIYRSYIITLNTVIQSNCQLFQ